MRAEQVFALVSDHSGVSTDRAEAITRVVLSGIGAWLPNTTRSLIADELPPSLAAALLDIANLAVPLEERLVEPHIGAAHARELVASVCHALAELLSIEALRALQAALPSSIADLFTPAVPEEPIRHPQPHGTTLATGRPGSEHPLSEARPRR